MRKLGIVALFVLLLLGISLWRQSGVGSRGTTELFSGTTGIHSPAPVVAGGAGIPGPRNVAPAVQAALDDEGKDPTEVDRRKLKELDAVLAARNDNDPRLDLAFRELTAAAKRLFRERYETMPLEKLNERGTVVFLLGQNVKTPADAAFLSRVSSEKPCLSLGECGRESRGGDAHGDMGVNLTLVYPQVVALKAFEGYLRRPDRNPELVQEALAALRRARESENDVVARTAREILGRVGEG